MLNAKRAMSHFSPITREYINRMNLIEKQPMTRDEKITLTARMTQLLTPEQKETIERECMRAAIELQHSNPERGNRAARRAEKRRMK